MRKKSLFSSTITFAILGAIAFGAYLSFKDMSGPVISLDTGSASIPPENSLRVSPQSKLRITMEDPSGIRAIKVGIRKNTMITPVYSESFDTIATKQVVEVGFDKTQLRDGTFDLEIRATDNSLAGFGQGNSRTEAIPMQFDTKPPTISIRTSLPNIRRGGSAVVRYSVDEPVKSSGVLVGDYLVPGFLQQDGDYVCFFPFPYSMTPQDYKRAVFVTATDMADNATRISLPMLAINKDFKKDKMEISDNFLLDVRNKLGALAPNAQTPLDSYLYINSTVRSENVKKLTEINKNTVASMLWDGAFVRLPRAASRAGFADYRTFFYQGRQVGESYHLGFDLASVRNAEVPAANHGRVVFVGELGIYGNLVVIDHGMGVQTAYSHLNDTLVKVGDIVAKGQIIAHTGTTGLAFGDHLHFGVIVGGIEVTPLEWLDAKWIRDNITSRLQPQTR